MENKFVTWVALIGIYAALVFDIFSTTNSSPQTTELFASERADTLWRWVRIGAAISVLFVGMGAFMAWKDKATDKNSWIAPVIGGMAALVIMLYLYAHALSKGGGQIPGGNTAMVRDWLWPGLSFSRVEERAPL